MLVGSMVLWLAAVAVIVWRLLTIRTRTGASA